MPVAHLLVERDEVVCKLLAGGCKHSRHGGIAGKKSGDVIGAAAHQAEGRLRPGLREQAARLEVRMRARDLIGAQDRAAGLGRGKGEEQIGLRGRVADRIGALYRARPARHPFLRGLCRGGGSAEWGRQRHYKTEDQAHAFSLLRDCQAAVCVIGGRCLDAAVPYPRSPAGGA